MLSFKTEPKQLFQECVVIGPKIIIMVFTNLAQLDVYPDNRKGNARPVFTSQVLSRRHIGTEFLKFQYDQNPNIATVTL